jgi:ubiquinone/menaquinone biosynthesis C-methylase UbiE
VHEVPPADPGRTIDWGKVSGEYAAYRPGPPPSYYERLRGLGVGLPGQRILDLGTGTGALARTFARQGCDVVGIDVSLGQLMTARRLAREEGLAIDFRAAPAEDTSLPAGVFDAATANQCWLYFDRDRVVPEMRRVLRPGGVIVTSHLSWLPREDAVARRSEELVLKFNPRWTAGDWSGVVPAIPKWTRGELELVGSFVYDEAIEFTRETWRGRLRASRGVGASLSRDEVEGFDAEHAALLAATVPERFMVLHRIDAHVLRPR